MRAEASPVEEANALQSDVELLTDEERQELLQHMRKLMTESRRLVVHLGQNYNTLPGDKEIGADDVTVEWMCDFEREYWLTGASRLKGLSRPTVYRIGSWRSLTRIEAIEAAMVEVKAEIIDL